MSIFPTRLERRTLCGLAGEGGMEEYGFEEEAGSIQYEEEEDEEAVTTVVIDQEEEDEDVEKHSISRPTGKLASGATVKKVLETRREGTTRSDASTSTVNWPALQHREVGVQCDHPWLVQSSNVTTRPMTRSQTNKRSYSSTAISRCEIVRTNHFSYQSCVAAKQPAAKEIGESFRKTRAQTRLSNELMGIKQHETTSLSNNYLVATSPNFSLDSSNASSVLLPINTQFVTSKELKKQLLANVSSIMNHGASAVDKLMEGVPQNRQDDFQLAQKQLEWILRDDLLQLTTSRTSKHNLSY